MWTGRTRTDRPQGFTLLEVLIALVIIGIAMTAIFVSLHRSLRFDAHLVDQFAARTVAQNLLNEYQLGMRRLPVGGDARMTGSTTQYGRPLQWRVQRAQHIQQEANQYYQRVTIRVGRLAAGGVFQGLSTLAGFVRVRQGE